VLEFQQLDTLFDIAQGFTKASVFIPTSDPDQTPGLGEASN